MKPYYQDAWVTIYHGDCREVLPQLGRFDLLLTDPPYGVSGDQNSKQQGVRKKNDYGCFTDSIEYVERVVIGAFLTAKERCARAIITPGNRCLTCYPMPDSFGCFYQPASVGLQPWGRADAQPIFYYGKFPRDSQLIPGQKCSHVLTESPEKNGHPCPKPVDAWMKLVMAGSNEGETVLDIFAGSGTTGRACKDTLRKATLIELDEAYCEIAARRMGQEVFDFSAYP